MLHLELEPQLIPSGEGFEHGLKAFLVFSGHLSCVLSAHLLRDALGAGSKQASAKP